MKADEISEKYMLDRRQTGQLAIGSGNIGKNGEGFRIEKGVSPEWKRKLRENTQFVQKTDILALPKKARDAYRKYELNQKRIADREKQIKKLTEELATLKSQSSNLYSEYLKVRP